MKIAAVQNAVAEHYGVPVAEILSRRHAEPLNTYRQLAMHISLEYPENTTSKVGKYFERDHSTVVIANQRIKKKLRQDSDLRDDKNKIMQTLKFTYALGVEATLNEMIQQNIDRAKKLRHTD